MVSESAKLDERKPSCSFWEQNYGMTSWVCVCVCRISKHKCKFKVWKRQNGKKMAAWSLTLAVISRNSRADIYQCCHAHSIVSEMSQSISAEKWTFQKHKGWSPAAISPRVLIMSVFEYLCTLKKWKSMQQSFVHVSHIYAQIWVSSKRRVFFIGTRLS